MPKITYSTALWCCTVETLQSSCTILTFHGKAKLQTHSAFENLLVLGLSSVTQPLPTPLSLSSCHASGHPAISTGPHVLPLRASLIKLRAPQQRQSLGELLQAARTRKEKVETLVLLQSSGWRGVKHCIWNYSTRRTLLLWKSTGSAEKWPLWLIYEEKNYKFEKYWIILIISQKVIYNNVCILGLQLTIIFID